MYIEINLLPQSFRPKRRLIRLDYKSVMVLVILIAAACVGGYYYYLRKESARIDSQISFYRQEEVKLRGAVALNKEVNDLKKLVEERIGIIRELTGGSEVRFSMLEHINLVMPENLWLMSISENEQAGTVSFTIEGISYTKDDISVFLAGLVNFEEFSAVSLESIRPAPTEVRDAFNYIIRVSLKNTGQQAEPAVSAANARRPARR